ncbi:MAG: hypothetical protein B7733_05025 [Myxococcales bacterium FL481]|nr:MAG: hypothetical protein B7733_05025 [Myxococcales bacterium FL481]
MATPRPDRNRFAPLLLGLSALAGVGWWLLTHEDISSTAHAIWLSCAIALGLALERSAWGQRVTGRRVLIAVMALVCAATLYLRGQDKVPKLARGEFMQGWNVYHYYMGSKYFDELGYFGLYKYTFLADREDRNVLRKVRKTRDLHDYRWVPVQGEIDSIETNGFSPARWSAFKRDLGDVFDLTRRRTARRMVTDLGYNATPFGHLVFSTLSSRLSLGDVVERTVLLSLDWVILIPAFFVFGRAFGGVRAFAFVGCFMLFFGATPFHFGGMLRFFWLATVLVGISCYKLGHYKTAGFAFALAVAERVFPVFFLVGPALHVAWSWFRTKRLPHGRVNFAASFLAGLTLCFALTLTGGRGLRDWREFGENMFHHADFQYLVEKKFGVKRIFSHDFGADKQPHSADKARKRRIFREQETYYRLTLIALLGCVVIIYVASDEGNSMLVGMIPAFVLEDISKYYLVLWFLLFCMGPPLFRSRYKYAVFDVTVVGLIPAYYLLSQHTKSAMNLYTSANFYMVATVVGLTALLLGELRRRRRAPNRSETPAT